MKCGFYEFDITPPMGSIIPGSFNARYCDDVLDKIYVRAFVAQNDDKLVALAVIDACGITFDITESIRKRTTELVPIKEDDIMIMATHTHSGGPTLNWGEEVVTDEYYLDFLAKRTADAIYIAWKRMADSEILLGKDEIHDISFIRVYHMKDGSLKTNPGRKNVDSVDRPTTTIDPELIVMGVKQGEKMAGAIINFATHPASIFTNQITGDYISVLSKEMKMIYGEDFVTVFINGACGNINDVNLYEKKKTPIEEYTTVGKAIAEKSVQILSDATCMNDITIKTAYANIPLRLRKPTSDELVEAKKLFDSYGDSLIESTPTGPDPNYINMFFALQKFIIMADKRTVEDAYVQLFRIGSLYIAGTPTQIFTEFGKAIKKNIAGPCMVSAFANDYLGYVPTPDCMKDGVYEARLAPTSGLDSDSGDRIVNAITELYKKLNA